ncbi:MAG TPA: amidase [Thermomicrobiales bacterium]|nr:amidase [Thermomicrobiales bacterium]
MSDDICFMTATDLARQIKQRELSAREVMVAHLARIERVNPVVNAIPTFIGAEAAIRLADDCDRRLAAGDDVGPLHGLPIAHKDTEETAGMRTTWGSPIFKDYVPVRDSLIVERSVKAGALRIGKTNVPEWAAGSHTFNPVFGATLNPYDITKSCGGSSGGAAVCLATGMLPIADGSDLGGSLRNPGNFNNVVGFRPSPGRVPGWPSRMAWQSMSVKGPLARTVQDVALLFSVLAGPDPRAPFALTDPGITFRRPLERDFTGVKIAWSADLGGLPVDPRVTAALETQRHVFEDIGCEVDEATPDFSGANESFQTLRAHAFAASHVEHLRDNRGLLKDTVIWNAELGLRLSALDVATAETQRTALYERVRVFMQTYEFLICPVNQVPPFAVDIPYPMEINGIAMENYIDWMRSAYYITMTGLPAISVPCGFTPEGLPVGVQIVGRVRDDFGVLQLAHAFEQATRTGLRRPPVAN